MKEEKGRMNLARGLVENVDGDLAGGGDVVGVEGEGDWLLTLDRAGVLAHELTLEQKMRRRRDEGGRTEAMALSSSHLSRK